MTVATALPNRYMLPALVSSDTLEERKCNGCCTYADDVYITEAYDSRHEHAQMEPNAESEKTRAKINTKQDCKQVQSNC